MADLIQKTDTLNQGREKLNTAITDAETAKVVSEKADDKATQALTQSESTQTQLDTIVIEGDSSVEAAQARVSNTGTAYGTLKERLDSEHQDVTSRLAQSMTKTSENTQGIPPSPLTGVTITNNYTGIEPITFHGGWLYGFKNNTTIVRSNDDGETWADVVVAPYGSVHSIFWTNDGEVIITNSSQISKSTGWSVNPTTVTWTTKVTKSNPAGVGIIPWAIDGDGQKFIATEYSGPDRSESRYIWVSTDMGNTWNIVFDKFTVDPESTSHMHGVCYDRWADRFWVSHGHGILRGVYYSDDDGITWNKIGGEFQPDAAPTTIYATDNGIVCGSDSGDAGLYGIARTDNPADMEIRRTARWDVEIQGVTGFSYRSFREEKTGHVYVAFKSDLSSVASVIMAGTATTGSTVWTSPTKGYTTFTHFAISNNRVLGVINRNGVKELVKGNISSLGFHTFDKGNIMNGLSKNSTSIAIGKNVEIETAYEVVIGLDAKLEKSTSRTGNVVIGYNTQGSARSVAIGNNAQNLVGSTESVVIGNSTKASSSQAVVIGNGATAPSGATAGVAIGNGTQTATGGVAIGSGAKNNASSSFSTAVGSGASAGNSSVSIGRLATSGTNGVALGLNATVNHGDSVAIGSNVSTTLENQFNIGSRHLEMKKVTEPLNVPVDSGRLFIKDDGTGKLQLCVRLGASTIVLATQA